MGTGASPSMKDWSTTAADNDAAGDVNFAEGQAPNTVNNSARQLMADARQHYENMEWRDWGHSVTRTGNTTFTISSATTLAAIYTLGRKIKCTDSSTIYGTIVASSHAGSTHTVTIASYTGNLSASLSKVELGLDPANFSGPREFICMSEYGINEDGSTDNAAAFASAITDIRDGGTILIPPVSDHTSKKYAVASEIDCSLKRVRFLGVGRASHIFFNNATGADSLFFSSNATQKGVIVENCQISGNRSGSSNQETDGAVIKAVSSDGTTYIRDTGIINCYVNGMASVGHFDTCDGVKIIGNRTESLVDAGSNSAMGNLYTCRNFVVANNVMEDESGVYALQLNDPATSTTGDTGLIIGNRFKGSMSCRYHNRVRIIGNTVTYTEGDNYGGACLITNGMQRVVIEGNYLQGGDGNTNKGATVRVTDGAQDVIIKNNIIVTTSGKGHAINLNGTTGGEPNVIEGNLIYETGTSTNNGIFIEPAADSADQKTIIANNTVDGYAQGIYCAPSCRYTSITSNHVYNQSTQGIFVDGLASGNAEVTITGNTSEDKGIKNDNCKFFTIANNVVPYITTSGTATSRGIISGNMCRNIGSNAYIQVEGNYTTIVGNSIQDDGTGTHAGIYAVSTSDYTTITGNQVADVDGTNGIGIRVAGTNCLVANNHLINNWRGLQTDAGSSYATAGDNLIVNSGAGGATSFAGTDQSGSLA